MIPTKAFFLPYNVMFVDAQSHLTLVIACYTYNRASS